VTETDTWSKAKLTVTLSRAATAPVMIRFSTKEATAKGGTDFATATAVLGFAPGESVKTFNLSIAGDLEAEAEESFTVELTAQGAAIEAGTGTVTIADDDQAPPGRRRSVRK
jgi:hypothetical protein